jgi:hypothetical protein
MKTLFLLAPCALAATILLTGCEVDDYDDDVRYRRSAYHGGSVDFYYTSGRPYSRAYGPLVARDGRYYYSRGGTYVVYDRPTTVYRDDTRVVRRDVVVRDRDDVDRRRYVDRDDDVRVYRDRRYVDDGSRYDGSVRRSTVVRDDVRRTDYRSGGTRVRVIED